MKQKVLLILALQKARWTDETRATKVFPAAVDALMGAFVQSQTV